MKKLIYGYAPNGEPLFQRRTINRTSGYDLTFSAPKSVSIIGILKDHKPLIEAHRKAVIETLKQIELVAQTRLKSSGKVQFVNTNNLVIGLFEHKTNREDDPQLHTHCVVINATKYKGRWRSYYARTVFTQILEWGKQYRDRLAKLVQEIGFKIRQVKDGFWEIDGVPQKLVNLFSKRRQQIIEKVGERASGNVKRYATLTTRKKKSAKTIKELRKRWTKEIVERVEQDRSRKGPEANY